MVSAIGRELLMRKEELNNQTIKSIYFGGGTPSVLTSEIIEDLLINMEQNYKLDSEVEITLEANPDDISNEKLDSWKKIGINRLSLGIQSFFDEDLLLMNRAHTSIEALKALEQCRNRFDNLTLDLIYGIPGLTDAKWQENIDVAMRFEVPHISSYALTIEPKTVLSNYKKRGLFKEMEEEDVLTQFNLLIEKTGKKGMVHYEISNFGKPEYFSKHNISYWQGESYIGIGPAAHSFNGTERSWNIASNPKYLKAIHKSELPATIEKLSAKDRYNEYVMTGLRTIWGVSLTKIKTEFGLEAHDYLIEQVTSYLISGHAKRVKQKNGDTLLQISPKGKFLVDGIASDLFIV
jgi:oxygen-independent coproporphyrinogen-3 oxidase